MRHNGFRKFAKKTYPIPKAVMVDDTPVEGNRLEFYYNSVHIDKNRLWFLLDNSEVGEQLTGEAREALWDAFTWSSATYGVDYWKSLAEGTLPVVEKDLLFFCWLLTKEQPAAVDTHYPMYYDILVENGLAPDLTSHQRLELQSEGYTSSQFTGRL